MVNYIKLFLAVVLSFMVGVLSVRYLTVHPLNMSLYLALTLVALFGLIAVLAIGLRGWRLFVGIGLSLAFFALGYIVMTQVFLSRDDPRSVPAITRQMDDPGLGHTAVVYFTHGEPETYDPIGWINQFNEFEEQDVPFVPLVVKPLFVNELRNNI